MTAALRYLGLLATRTREPLPAIGACLFAVIGVYAYKQNEVAASYALTAVLSVGLTAWVTGAMARSEPAAQADVVTVAAGGRGGRLRIESALVLAVAVATTVLFVVYPIATRTFDRAVTAHDVITATTGHLACGLLGGTIGVLFAPPRVRRTATGVAAVFAALIALAADPVGGPVSVAHALEHDDAVWLPALTCVAGAALLAWLAAAWSRRAA